MTKVKHITEPDVFGFQVRIVRRGKESSRYFSHKLWGSKTKSLKAAINWRDQMLVTLKGSKTRFLKPPKNKTTTGVTGVSRTIKFDHRKDKSYLCYTVFWVCQGKSRNKTFQVGNVESVSADDELHAFPYRPFVQELLRILHRQRLAVSRRSFFGLEKIPLIRKREFESGVVCQEE